MKTAQELRVGNVFMVGNDAMVVLKAEYSKSGRNASVVKMKMKNLLTGTITIFSISYHSAYRKNSHRKAIALQVLPFFWIPEI